MVALARSYGVLYALALTELGCNALSRLANNVASRQLDAKFFTCFPGSWNKQDKMLEVTHVC